MPTSKRQRRPELRPDEIADAAFGVFAKRGFAAARMDDIAAAAGVSKGTLYLYFPGKEALFEAAVSRLIGPRIELIRQTATNFGGSTADLIRQLGQLMAEQAQRPEMGVLIRLLISEAQSFPALTEIYHRQVIAPGMAMLRALILHGVETGEFRETALPDLPQWLMAPFVTSVIWRILFERLQPLDVERLIAMHIDFTLEALRVRT